MKEAVVVFRISSEQMLPHVQNELTGDVIDSNIDTEALVLSVDRVLNFFSVENSLFQELLLAYFLFCCFCFSLKDF